MPCFHAGRLSATLATWLVSSAACAVGDDSDVSFGSATGAGPGGDEGPSSDGESSGDDGAATTGPDAPTTTAPAPKNARRTWSVSYWFARQPNVWK